MAETVDAIIAELATPRASDKAKHLAHLLVQQVPTAHGFGASDDDIVAGFSLAASRVAAWRKHKNWPRLRDQRDG